MSTQPTIFISYNPSIPDEETLAVRLQTIGAVNGFNTLLPDRFSGIFLNDETKRRILTADYFVIFSSGSLSAVVQQEIDVAFAHFQDPSKILVIYNPNQMIPMVTLQGEATLIPFDPHTETVDIVIQKVVHSIRSKENAKANPTNGSQNGLLALLGIGLGLLVLTAILSNDRD